MVKKNTLTTFLILIFDFLVFNYYLISPVYASTKSFWSDDLVNNVVYNPYQGLGVCHWASPTILSDPIVSWAYDATGAVLWNRVEPQENQFDWSGMDSLVALAKSKGKKIWLQLYNPGSVPQWALDKTVDGEKIIMMGTDNPPYNCSAMNKNIPLPWNQAYLALWRKAIHQMAEKYDNDPTVEAIVIMAGGGYGEMAVCSTCGPASCWQQFAGGTNIDTKFSQSVNNLVDLYLEKEHVWGNEGVLPAGTKTHGFLNKPVILQLGAGLYGHTTTVIKPVLDYVIPKYGMRVLLKSNAWNVTNCTQGHEGISQDYFNGLKPDQTKFGLEPAFPTDDFNTESEMTGCGRLLSYACLQSRYWDGNNGNNLNAMRPIRENLAKRLGSKVGLKEVIYPEAVTAGQSYDFSVSVKNLGVIPPFRPKREDNNNVLKDKAGSYQLTFQLVKDNQIDFRYEQNLNPGSNSWTNGQEYTITANIPIPIAINNGDHELRIALFDPEAADRFRQPYFRFLNKEILDEEGRAKIGTVSVQGGSSFTPVPSGPPSSSSASLQVNFEGAPNEQPFIVSLLIKGTDFLKKFLIYGNRAFNNLSLPGLVTGQTYEFILSSFPFLKNKISLAPAETAPTLNFGTLKTGDLNGDNAINGLDWSIMKGNFGESGEE